MSRPGWCRHPHRGAVLATWSVITSGYGAGIVSGYRPTFTAALHMPVLLFGWWFIAVALVAVTGVFTRSDRCQFAVTELAAAGWGLLLCTHWTEPYGWASGLSWLMVAVLMLIVSGWREPVRVITPPVPEPGSAEQRARDA